MCLLFVLKLRTLRSGEDARDIEERFGSTTERIERGIEDSHITTCRENIDELFSRRLKDRPTVGFEKRGAIGRCRIAGGKDSQRFVSLGHSPGSKTGLLRLHAVEEIGKEIGGRGVRSQGAGSGVRGQESGVRCGGSGVRDQESNRGQETGDRRQQLRDWFHADVFPTALRAGGPVFAAVDLNDD